MKATIFALAASLSLTSALPAGGPQYPPFPVTLFGATNSPVDQYTVNAYLNGQPVPSGGNPLSISYVKYDHNAAICTFVGVDSDKSEAAKPREGAVFTGDNTKSLGPPQTILSVTCTPIYSNTGRATVHIVLHGATNDPADQYAVDVPIQTSSDQPWAVPASIDVHRLSISRVEYDHSSHCAFHGVDSLAVEANGGQVGPPQTIKSILCY